MKLCHLSLIPTAEFASVSLLLEADKDSSSTALTGESLSVVSPLATTSLSDVVAQIAELHQYVNSAQPNEANGQSTGANGDTGQNDSGTHMPTQNMSSKDQVGVSESKQGGNGLPQIFRSSRGHGTTLHFLVNREPAIVRKCSSIILPSSKGSARSTGHGTSPQSIAGILVCVGVSGLSYAQPSSALVHTMEQRVLEFIKFLRRMDSFTNTAECKTSIEAVLSTLILTDDEERRTNAMVEAESITLSSEMSELESPSEKVKSTVSALKNKRGPSSRHSQLKRGGSGASGLRLSLDADSSANKARIAAEKQAVLSVAEKDAGLKRYASTGQERRSSLEMELGKSRVRSRRRKADEAVLPDFDCPEAPETPSATSRLVKPLARPRNDLSPVASTNGAFTKKPAVPTLSAPRNDVARIGSNRKTNQPSARRSIGSPNSLRPEDNFPSPPVQDRIFQRQDAFDAFAISSMNLSGRGLDESFPSMSLNRVDGGEGGHPVDRDELGFNVDFFGTPSPSQSLGKKSPNNRGFDPFTQSTASAVDWSAESAVTASSSPSTKAPSTAVSSRSRERPQLEHELSTRRAQAMSDPEALGDREFGLSSGQEWTSPVADEILYRENDGQDNLGGNSVRSISEKKDLHSNNDEHTRLTVNIALNEDLTCSYKKSKISSCTVEGVVQVQVSSDAANGVPFFLFVIDPSQHVKILQENRRYADDITQALVDHDEVERGAHYKFTVSVPKSQNYFPIMRYKCSTELRPVPIRVQTRVRLNGTVCRVALQISSNPANEDDLTDLTIMMGVPPEVRGESLITSPAGGVWNSAKRSVVWCVAELGEGEKFQLQAQFEMDPERVAAADDEKPKFPVLVRCQCMYSQLSNIELEVSDIPEIFPADVSMKLARRFRLSHRERS